MDHLNAILAELGTPLNVSTWFEKPSVARRGLGSGFWAAAGWVIIYVAMGDQVHLP